MGRVWMWTLLSLFQVVQQHSPEHSRKSKDKLKGEYRAYAWHLEHRVASDWVKPCWIGYLPRLPRTLKLSPYDRRQHLQSVYWPVTATDQNEIRWTAKGRSHHHDGGGTGVFYLTHFNSLLSWLSCPVEPKRLPVQKRVLAAWGMKLTTDLHLVLQLNNGIFPSLPPCAPSLLYNRYRTFPGGRERPVLIYWEEAYIH